MFEFLTPQISSFGIDLSDLSIKIIKLKKTREGFKLASFIRKEIKEGLIEEGEIKKEAELIELIRKAIDGVKGEALKTEYCTVSLPETESFLRMVKLPSMKKEEAAEAIKWELEANIPLSVEEIYYDWQIIEDANANPRQLDILVGVLPKKTVNPYLNVLKKAGLKPLAFEIESIATARALINKDCRQNAILIIDIGAKRTSFFIYSGQAIYFTSSLPISNNQMTKTLSEKLGIALAKAREIKFKVGIDYKHSKSKVFEALKPSLLELSEKIKLSADFHKDHHPSAAEGKITQVLLCGGGANLAGLPKFLSDQLKRDVTIGNPWINVSDDPSQATGGLQIKDPLAYTTAIGLALRNYET
ncbi:type IV pilus assembly protein PilM [Patescibacteria group bacterium]|nr:type IV pilus assembly protein PilM [Patescibacteria group bacterium]